MLNMNGKHARNDHEQSVYKDMEVGIHGVISAFTSWENQQIQVKSVTATLTCSVKSTWTLHIKSRSCDMWADFDSTGSDYDSVTLVVVVMNNRVS
jgi:hypothetical protein